LLFCSGTLPRSSAVADDIPELQPLADRVLVEVEDTADVTIGGVVLPDSAKERPLRWGRLPDVLFTVWGVAGGAVQTVNGSLPAIYRSGFRVQGFL
jgi:hypothetical protein